LGGSDRQRQLEQLAGIPLGPQVLIIALVPVVMVHPGLLCLALAWTLDRSETQS
jgi:hypothetical protein